MDTVSCLTPVGRHSIFWEESTLGFDCPTQDSHFCSYYEPQCFSRDQNSGDSKGLRSIRSEVLAECSLGSDLASSGTLEQLTHSLSMASLPLSSQGQAC